MYCHNCGKKIDDSAKFCCFCGTKQILIENSSNNNSTASIPSINKSSVQNQANKKETTPVAKTVSSTTNVATTSTPQEKKSYGCLIAAILIILFIVGITIALVKIVDLNKTNDNSSSSSGGSGVHLFYRDANNGDIDGLAYFNGNYAPSNSKANLSSPHYLGRKMCLLLHPT